MMKSRMHMLGLMSLMLSMDNTTPTKYVQKKESEEERKRRKIISDIEIAKAHGLKEFIYEGISVWAINQKNADKKAKKLNLLT